MTNIKDWRVYELGNYMQKFEITIVKMPIKKTVCHLCGSDKISIAIASTNSDNSIKDAFLICCDCEVLEKVVYGEYLKEITP